MGQSRPPLTTPPQVVLLRGPDLGCALVELPGPEHIDALLARKYALRGSVVLVQVRCVFLCVSTCVHTSL